MGFDAKGLESLRNNLEKLSATAPIVAEDALKELAARFITAAVKVTPVGDYSKEIEVTAKRDGKFHKKGDVYKKSVNTSGKQGGTLRRGWTSLTQEEAEKKGNVKPEEHVNRLEIQRLGNISGINVINPVDYGLYVDKGHLTRDRKRWVAGKYMVQKALNTLDKAAPAIIKKHADGLLREGLKK